MQAGRCEICGQGGGEMVIVTAGRRRTVRAGGERRSEIVGEVRAVLCAAHRAARTGGETRIPRDSGRRPPIPGQVTIFEALGDV